MVCSKINYLQCILQYTIYILYKILEYSEIFQNTKILLVWSLYSRGVYYTKQVSVYVSAQEGY